MPVKLGGSSSSYSIYTDPKMQVMTAVHSDKLGIWDNTTFVNGQDSSLVYTYMAQRGSVVQCSNVAANTWKQIMSVTGSGFLGTIVFPRLTNNNASTWTIEYTIDGVVTERTTPSLGSWNDRRLVIGNIIAGSTQNEPNGISLGGYGMVSPGHFDNYDGLGGKVVSTGSTGMISIVPVDVQLRRGQPVLKFNTSLSVRVKSNNSCAFDNSHRQYAGALYIVNP